MQRICREIRRDEVPLAEIVVLHKYSHQAVVLVLSEAVLVIADLQAEYLWIADYEHRYAEHEYKQLSP